MSKFKFTLPNILFWVGIIASCLLLENVAFFTGDPTGQLAEPYFYIIFVIAMTSLLAYQVFDRVLNKSYGDQFILALTLVFFAASMVAIWGFQGYKYTNEINPSRSFKYLLNDYDKIKQSFVSFTFFFAVYSVLFTFNKNHPTNRRINYVFIIVMIICYALGAHSLITEFTRYQDVANGIAPSESIKSLFWNENAFACLMLMGVFCSMGLNLRKKNVFSYISIIAFTIEIIFIGSLTCILIDITLVLIYFLLEVIFIFRKSIGLGLTCLSIYILVSVSVFVLFAAAQTHEMGTFSNFCRYLNNVVLQGDYLTFTNRIAIWNGAIELSNYNVLSRIFGYGFRNSGPLMGLYHENVNEGNVINGTISTHNAALQVLLNFGYVGCAAYGALLIYFIYAVIRLCKKDARYALVSGLIGAGMLSYGMTESVIFLNPNVQGFLVFALFYLPVINRYKHYKKETVGLALIVNLKTPVKMLDVKYRIRGMAKFIVGLAASVATLFMFEDIFDYAYVSEVLLNILASLGILFLTFPYVFGLWGKDCSRPKFVARILINIIIVGSLFAGLTSVMLFTTWFDSISWRRWFFPILLGAVMLIEVIVYSIRKKGKFSEYASTFVGMTKNSFMGLIGVGGVCVGLYFTRSLIELSLLTTLLIPAFSLLIFFIFSYFVPFKDVKAIGTYYNDIDASMLKTNVMDERLRLKR